MKIIFSTLFLLTLIACGNESPPARPTTPIVIDAVQEQHWVTLPVKIRLDSAFSDAEIAALMRAMDSWSSATGKELFEVTMDESAPAYIGRDWNTDPERADRYNDDFFAYSRTTVNGSVIKSGIIYFNQANNDFIDFAGLTEVRGLADMESIAVHEIGHLLGVDHTEDKSCVMFSEYRSGVQRVLGEWDREEIRKRYSE